MKIDIVSIGNSKGIRLPSALIKQLGLGSSLELSVDGNRLVLKKPSPSKKAPRKGWAEDAKRLSKKSISAQDKEWLDADLGTDADAEWTW